jgi:AcrR family transcriptional regulator
MGAKGLQTRRRMIGATEELLKSKPLRELRVSDIARAAKTSTSTFYLYFQDVPEAVLAVISEVSQSTPSFLSIVGAPWEEADAYDRAQHFVETYFEFWQTHGALFRVRNLAADEGDVRFVEARANSVRPLLQALAARIEERQGLGALPRDLHALSTAGALLAMIERIAVIPASNLGRNGVTRDRVAHAVAFFAAVVLGGRATVGEG